MAYWTCWAVLLAATIAARTVGISAVEGEATGPTIIVGVAHAGAGPLGAGDWFDVGDHVPLRTRAWFDVVGGYGSARGWISSDGAVGIMPEGAVIGLYGMRSPRPAGEITLTGRERVGTDNEVGWGLMREAWFTKPTRARDDEYVGIWSSERGTTPRWLAAEPLSTTNAVYRRIVGEWLSARGVAPSVISTVDVTQIVRTDINGDGRDEVFLAFGTPGIAQPDANAKWRPLCSVRNVSRDDPDCHPGPTPEVFSYLVMRHLPPGRKAAETIVLADDSLFEHEVLGVCDVNGDGWAEVVSRETMIDYSNTRLNCWTGSRYMALEGVGGSV